MSFKILDDERPEFHCPNCGKGYNAWWWDREYNCTESTTCWECDFEFEVKAEVCCHINYTVKPVDKS